MKKKRKLKTAITPSLTSLLLCIIVLFPCTIFLTPTFPLHGREHPKPPSYGLIFGTVWGPDDRPGYGVTVKIRRANEKKARWEAHSNHLGEFEQRVPAGKQDYVLWADLRGFKSPVYKHLQSGPEVTLHIESDERVNTGLHLK